MDYIFTWNIHNYLLYHKRVEKISSPKFIRYGSEWYLNLQIVNVGNDDYFSLYLNREQDDGMKFVVVDFEVEMIFGLEGKILNSYMVKNFPFFSFVTYGCTRFVKIDEIIGNLTFSSEDILTINCRISLQSKHSDLEKELRFNTLATTDFCSNEYSFTCDLEQTNSSVWAASEKIYIPQVMTFEMRMFSLESSTYIEFIKTEILSSELVCFTAAMLDDERSVCASAKAIHLFNSTDSEKSCKIPVFCINTNERFVPQSKNQTIICKFSIANGIAITEFEGRLESISHFENRFNQPNNVSTLLKDFYQSLTKDSKYSDVKLEVDSEIYNVHRAILAAWSPVFSVMFDKPMLERKTGVVEITDIDADTFKEFLDLLYTGSAGSLNYETAVKLLILADKYQIRSIVDKCASYLICNLCFDNVYNVLSITDLISHNFLKSAALDYILNCEKNPQIVAYDQCFK